MINRITKFIFRGWDEVKTPPPPGRLRLLPPFLFDLLSWALCTAVAYGLYLYFSSPR